MNISNGVNWNTHKKFTYCTCKKIWVDGCEDLPH